MSGTVATRKLAAILAIDVVGYSRLMNADEEGTQERVRDFRLLVVQPRVEEFGGRLFKAVGDGFLSEFPSSVAAVRAAIAIRSAAGGLTCRYGVNVGDVIVEDDDLFGDSVNIAARLEGIAEPGAIYLSEDVYRQVRGKVDAGFVDLGERALKNIAEPVRVYQLAPSGGLATPPAKPKPSDRARVAVLPFANLSGDPAESYFSDGVTEDIITDLSLVPGLFVVSRNSSFVFRGQSIRAREIGERLAVAFVVTGSVQKAGSRVRITVSLVDTATEGHVWSDRLDRDLGDVFALQDEVAHRIVDALKVHVPGARLRNGDRGTTNLEAYELFMRGRELSWQMTADANPEAARLIEAAIALDPNFARAYAVLSNIIGVGAANRWGPDANAELTRSIALARKAVALAPDDAMANWTLAMGLAFTKHYDEAEPLARRAIELDPNSAPAFVALGNILLGTDRPAEALDALRHAEWLDPYPPSIFLHYVARALIRLGRFDEAESTLRRRIDLTPGTDISRVLLAAVLGHKGDVAGARAAWADALRLNPHYDFEWRRQILPDPEFKLLLEGMERAGIPIPAPSPGAADAASSSP